MQNHGLEERRKDLTQVLQSKVEEFRLLGYQGISHDDIWAYFIKKKWKKRDEVPFYEMVNDILTLTPQAYMTFVTIEFMQ